MLLALRWLVRVILKRKTNMCYKFLKSRITAFMISIGQPLTAQLNPKTCNFLSISFLLQIRRCLWSARPYCKFWPLNLSEKMSLILYILRVITKVEDEVWGADQKQCTQDLWSQVAHYFALIISILKLLSAILTFTESWSLIEISEGHAMQLHLPERMMLQTKPKDKKNQ